MKTSDSFVPEYEMLVMCSMQLQSLLRSLRGEKKPLKKAQLCCLLHSCIVCGCVHATVHVSRSEDSLQESVLSHHVSPRNTPQVAVLSSKGLCIMSHLTSAYGVVFSSSPPGESLSSIEHLAKSEDIFGCHN